MACKHVKMIDKCGRKVDKLNLMVEKNEYGVKTYKDDRQMQENGR
ncbi:hypothetical protein [Metabacillus litoralis]|nr:hypothetical protein [Metabacillus litoralis]